MAAGIPNGPDGKIFRKVLRIAKKAYNYKDLKPLSLCDQALPYDHLLFHKDVDPPLKNPSCTARKQLGMESAVF